VNITVKNVPDPVYEAIKKEAKRKGRSLNAEIVKLLENEAAEAQRLRRLTNVRAEFDRLADAIGPLDDSAPLIREDRER
jgi:plasmid stability protein